MGIVVQYGQYWLALALPIVKRSLFQSYLVDDILLTLKLKQIDGKFETWHTYV